MAFTPGGRPDEAAFERLYPHHAPRLLAIATRICGDRTLAQDAVQDAMLSIWRSRRRYDGSKGSFSAWSAATVANRAIDALRVEARHGRTLDALRSPACSAVAETPADVLVRRESHRELRAALATLPRRNAEAIVLAFYGELSYREVAEHVAEPTSTVKARVRRGLRQLAC